KERGLAGDERVEAMLAPEVWQAPDDQTDRAEERDREEHGEVRAEPRPREGMDRLKHAAAREEGAEDREAIGQDHEDQVPDLQHPLLLLDHDRVQEGGPHE